MKATTQLLWAALLVAAWTDSGAASQTPSSDSPALSIGVSKCFKGFEEKVKDSFPDFFTNNENLFRPPGEPPAPRPKDEFHFHLPNTQFKGRLRIFQSKDVVTLIRQFRSSGVNRRESVRQVQLIGAFEPSAIVEKCEEFSGEFLDFLAPQAQFMPADVPDKFKELFAAAFDADKRLELVEVEQNAPAAEEQPPAEEHPDNSAQDPQQPVTEEKPESPTQGDGQPPEEGKSDKPPERSLEGGPLAKWVFRVMAGGAQAREIGHVDFIQTSQFNLVVNAKVKNQFSAKTFVSFTNPLDMAVPSLEAIVAQLSEVVVPEEPEPTELETMIEDLLKGVNCEVAKQNLKSEDGCTRFVGDFSPKVELPTEEEGGMDGLNLRGRRLAEKACPFKFLIFALNRIRVDGFPSLQVSVEANTHFLVPMVLDYFISGDTKQERADKVRALFANFVDVFNRNEADRLASEEKSKKFSELLKQKAQQQGGSLVGSTAELADPDKVPPFNMSEAVDLVVKHITEIGKKALGSNLQVPAIRSAEADGKPFEVRDGSRTIMMVTPIPESPIRFRVTFFLNPDWKGQRAQTFQMEFSTDKRLSQMEIFEQQLQRYFAARKVRSVL